MNTKNPDLNLHNINNLLFRDRIIMCTGEVNDAMAQSVVSQLLALEADNPKEPITLYIQSPGGSVMAGFAMYDTMQYISCPVHTVCLGYACSMGAFLLSAGAKGHRYALPHSQIMIHQPLGGFSGQVTDVEIRAGLLIKLKEILISRMAQHCEKTYEELYNICERDKWLSPEEAMELGLIDSIQTYKNPSVDVHLVSDLLKIKDFTPKDDLKNETESQGSTTKVAKKKSSNSTSKVTSKSTIKKKTTQTKTSKTK